MSGSSCMWCTSHPRDWKTHPLPQCDIWTVKRIKDRKQKIEVGILMEPSDIQGIVNNAILKLAWLITYSTTFICLLMIKWKLQRLKKNAAATLTL
jgi:hypothetical protein